MQYGVHQLKTICILTAICAGAIARAGDDKPILFVAGSSACDPCIKLQNEYLRPMSVSINARFDLKYLDCGTNHIQLTKAKVLWHQAHIRKPEAQRTGLRLPFMCLVYRSKIIGYYVGYTSGDVRKVQDCFNRALSDNPPQAAPYHPEAEEAFPEYLEKLRREEAEKEAQRKEKKPSETIPPATAPVTPETKQVAPAEKPPTSIITNIVEAATPAVTGVAGSGIEAGADSGLGGPLQSILKLGFTGAALYFGLPVGAAGLAAAVAGFAIGRVRRRVHARVEGSHTANTQYVNRSDVVLAPVADSGKRVSTNHYITKVVDIEGEAYKEAIRKVSAAYAKRSLSVAEIMQVLEHTAKEVARGKSSDANDLL